nr:NS1 [Kampung Karu virus]
GCSLDPSRKELRCGEGVFLMNEVDKWKDNYRMHPMEPKRLASAIWSSHKKGICGVASTNRLEHIMWHSVSSELNALLDANGKNITVVVGSSNYSFPVGGKKLQNGAPLEIGWKKWGKSILMDPEEKESLFYVDGDAVDCPYENRAWNIFKVEDFGVGLFHTSIWLEERGDSGTTCDEKTSGAAVKGDRGVHADLGSWIESKKNESWFLERAHLTEIKWCSRSKGQTIHGDSVELSKLVIPVEIAGPRSWMNTRSGYSTQTHGPWHVAPLEVRFEECPGTTVKVDGNCTGRKSSARTTDKFGKVIPEWCCKACTLPPLSFWAPDGCWYGMEVQPVSHKEKSLIRSWVHAAD